MTSEKRLVLGLIGHPLTHSFSKSYFTEKFLKEGIGATYENFDLADIAEFPSLLKGNPYLQGLNVTIPYKETIIPYLDELVGAAKDIGAVNTIQFKGGKLLGHNTDYLGFTHSIKPLLSSYHTKALILGTGGASKAVVYALNQLGVAYQMVSREPEHGRLSYPRLDHALINEHTVIINTTPVGMHPNINHAPPIPYEYLSERHLLFDLIYNPEETLFLKKGREAGAITKNGLQMLQLQAEAAWDIWNG